MPLILVTGSAGTGKSSVCQKLREKGYTAYDTDIDGLSKWQNKETGYIYPESTIKDEDRTTDFLKVHSWIVPRYDLEQLNTLFNKKVAFICGALGNLNEVKDLFVAMFALYVDDATLKHRLKTRTTGDWGKLEHELKHTLKSHQVIYAKYRKLGIKVIDATKPIEQVTESILTQI